MLLLVLAGSLLWAAVVAITVAICVQAARADREHRRPNPTSKSTPVHRRKRYSHEADRRLRPVL